MTAGGVNVFGIWVHCLEMESPDTQSMYLEGRESWGDFLSLTTYTDTLTYNCNNSNSIRSNKKMTLYQ